MRAARGYESPNAFLNPGQLPILGPVLFYAPEPYRNRDAEVVCLQSLLDAALSSATCF
jgi:hypothetical protein